MDSEYIEVIGSQATRPAEIDVDSSALYVYLRKDIKKYEEKDDDQNVIFSGWQYQERKVLKSQWIAEATVQNKTNIDAIMMGLTDLFELQLELQNG